jgi:hypothetical protein
MRLAPEAAGSRSNRPLTVQKGGHLNAIIDYGRSFRRIGRDARLWLLSRAFSSFVNFGVAAVLLNLYLLRIGYGPAFVGLLAAVGRLSSMATALPAAAAGRRMGLRNAMVAGGALVTLCWLAFLLAEGFPLPFRGGWLVGSQVLLFCGISLIMVNQSPYVMGVTTEEERNYALAGQQGLETLAGAIGALAAGWLPGYLAARLGTTLENPAPYRLALISGPLSYALVTLALLRARPEPAMVEEQAQGDAPVTRAPLRTLVPITLLIFLFYLGAGSLFVNVYLDDALGVSTARIGALMGVVQLVPLGGGYPAHLGALACRAHPVGLGGLHGPGPDGYGTGTDLGGGGPGLSGFHPALASQVGLRVHLYPRGRSAALAGHSLGVHAHERRAGGRALRMGGRPVDRCRRLSLVLCRRGRRPAHRRTAPGALPATRGAAGGGFG